MPSKSSKPKEATDSRSKPSPTPQTPPVQNLPTTSNLEPAKKKKKKKNKSKTAPLTSESRADPKYEEEEDEDDDIPPLEPAPGLYRSLTGLPPELEAVHLSATASLSATVAAAARNNPTAAAHAELIAAADDLCRRMDADPQGGISTDDDYWKSLPEHIRNFAQAMYAIAQQMVQSSGGKGPTKGTPGYPPGAFPTSNLPFDQSILSRSPFNALMEQAVAPYLPTTNSPSSPRAYYSEDEQDCDDEDGEEETGPKDEPVSNTSFSPQPPPPHRSSQPTPRSSEKAAGAKTSGNSNSTNVGSGGGGGGQPPEFAASPALADAAPRHSPGPVSVTTNAAMSPANRVPPPSSRAAGKQPMSYNSQQQNSTSTTTATRSARAASKQPLSAANYPHNPTHHHPSPPSSNASGPHKSRQNAPASNQPPKNNKIWSTSSTEERERIKEFWLGLGEEERRNLVKVEKEAVLKKMKEQQKHSCSCAVCGRKRNAIEDELEVLYDAYYEELEQYANYQQRYVSSGGALPPPPGPGPFPGSVELDKNGAVVGHHKLQPPSSRPNSRKPPITSVPNGRAPKAQVKHPESEFEDDQDEDEYEEDDEYEAEEDDEEDEDEDDGEGEGEDGDVRHPRVTSRRAGAPTSARRRTAADAKPERDKLFSFGNSLTVTDNILTVADDLLKNDGQKFLEMMEQLADRRMIREDRATGNIEDDSEEDDGDDDGDEDDEDEDDDEEEEEEEEEEPMTEDQKVEEGRKMFSIFAARMFEQRVLQAYREQVAQERQLQLLRELEDEDKATKEKEAKKQNQNQKKKDKKKQQRLAKEGEKAAKAAEKAAEDALLKAKQQAMEEEQKKKREEERFKREAARKAQEEEKQRKEEERRKRQTEEKERQAEQERKRKEREEKVRQERRDKEERDRKVKEEREAKERAAATAKREQQEKEEREKKAREEKEKAERERLEKEKAEKEKEARAAQQSRKQAARPPPSPRSATASGSTQRPSQPQTTPKKVLTKSASTSAVSPVPSVSRQNSQPRPVIVTNQSVPQTPTQASNPPTPGYSPGVNGTAPQQTPLVSPRVPFNPPQQFNGFIPAPPIPQQGPGPALGPSPIPRNFGAPGFDPYPARPIGTSAIVNPGPIGPPQKTNPNPPPPSMLAPGSGRRQSLIVDPGPIGPPRPLQPIARPTEQSGSGSASPVRRSPSPKVLGSSALATEDDEVVPSLRRTVVNGPVWGAAPVPPRASVDLRGPWGPPPPGFPVQSPNLPRPSVGQSPWGTTNPNDQWHPSNFFPPGQFVGHNPSPPPHSGN